MLKRHLIIALVSALWFAACSKDDSTAPPPAARQATVTLLTTVNGLGDNGYNDLIARGLFAFSEKSGVRLRLLLPDYYGEAQDQYDKWLKENAATDSAILILGSPAYAAFADTTKVQLQGAGSRVLLLGCETKNPNVHSVMIDHYGVSYLCGAMSKDASAFILAATPNDSAVQESVRGFIDGHQAHADAEYTQTVQYLTDDEQGFAMPDSAFRVISARIIHDLLSKEFFFPVLGGSSLGAIKAMNYGQINFCLIIGMDVNQSGLCDYLPFSMLVHIDKVLCEYLTDWTQGKEWPHTGTLGLDDRATDVEVNPFFSLQRLNPSHTHIHSIEEYEELYKQFYDEAVRKENEYESRKQTR